jgi:hypothetical protein
MIRVRADDDGRSLLRGGLIGKRKWDQNDVAEAIGGRIRHRQSCPRRRGMLPRTGRCSPPPTRWLLSCSYPRSRCLPAGVKARRSQRNSQTTEIVSGSGFGGSTTVCTEFNNAKAGPVTVFVTPPSIRLILRAETCNAPGQVLAEKDTELVNVGAPAGANHVRLSNPSELDTPYTLRLTFWR